MPDDERKRNDLYTYLSSFLFISFFPYFLTFTFFLLSAFSFFLPCALTDRHTAHIPVHMCLVRVNGVIVLLVFSNLVLSQ